MRPVDEVEVKRLHRGGEVGNSGQSPPPPQDGELKLETASCAVKVSGLAMALKGQERGRDCDGIRSIPSSGRSEQHKGHEQGQGGEFVKCAYPYFPHCCLLPLVPLCPVSLPRSWPLCNVSTTDFFEVRHPTEEAELM